MQYVRSCMLLIVLLCVPFCLHAAESTKKSEPVVHQLLEDAALRAKPYKSAKQVGTASKDSTVEVHAVSEKGWATVMHNGKKAYLEAALLKEAADIKEKNKPKSIMNMLLGLPALVWPLLLPYMIYRNVVKRYKPVTVEEMTAGANLPQTVKSRAELGVTSDEELDEKGAQLILEAYNAWTPLPDSDDKMLTDITQIRETGRVLKQVQRLCPTNPDMITAMNTLGDAVNQAEKRFFNGSYTHLTINTLIITLILVVIFWSSWSEITVMPLAEMLMMPLVAAAFLSLPLSYWLSARVPEWKAEGKSFSFSGAFLTELAASSGDHTITTTRYSDGSSTKRTTHTGLQAFSIWFLIIAFISWIILPYLIVINFWKNYVRA